MATKTLKEWQRDNKPNPTAADNGSRPGPGEDDQEMNAAISQPCVRCHHAPVEHLGDGCGVDGCGCRFFVYPSDFEEGQLRLPGPQFEPTVAERELEPLMRSFYEAENQRRRSGDLAKELADRLVIAMRKHNLTRFPAGGLVVEIEPGKVKVRVEATGDGLNGQGELGLAVVSIGERQ